MSDLQPDPWKVLGIEKNADKSEIRTAYRKLVLKCHPDKVQDPTLKAQKQNEFQRVQQAYELLNDDTERAKYEEKLKLFEMRKAAMLSKNMPNISASRTPPRPSHTFYEVRTADPQARFRHTSPHQPSPVPPGGKVYTHVYASSKSYEDEVSPRSQTVYDEERRARRTASYEQPSSRRDDEKREERKRREARDRKDEEDRERERERRDKELRKQERREREKIRDKEKRRDVEDKTSRRTKEVYVEEYNDRDIHEVYPPTAKVEKKKASSSSSTKKVDEPREKSSSRRERDESPRIRSDKHDYLKEEAAAYIERQRAKSKPVAPTLGRSQTFQQPSTYARVPSPPPADYLDDDDVRRSSARPSRRASNDAGVRSKERLYSASQKKSREDFEVVDALPRAERAGPPRSERVVPTLKKSNTMPTSMAPPVVPESPPRHPLRQNTAQEVYSRPPPAMPTMTRASTFAGEKVDRYPIPIIRGEYEPSDDEMYESRRRHRSRRTHSPEAATTTRRYKPNGISVTPIETVYEPDVYDHQDDYRSSRRHGSSYGPQVVEPGGRGGPEYYYDSPPAVPFGKVKIAKAFTPEDVAYTPQYRPSQGNWGGVVA